MATKTRLYEVTLRNGHRKWTEIYPAQSEASLRSELIFSDDIKIIEINSLDWGQVTAQPNFETDTVAFCVAYQDKEIFISNNDIGYSHLMQQVPNQVKNVNDFFNDEHNR